MAESTLLGLRDNWVDLAILVEFGESINRAAMRGDKFTAFIQDGIKVIKEEAGIYILIENGGVSGMMLVHHSQIT